MKNEMDTIAKGVSRINKLYKILCRLENLDTSLEEDKEGVLEDFDSDNPKVIESERIINIGELEELIRVCRRDLETLKMLLNQKEFTTAEHMANHLDAMLHQAETFEFALERRTITLTE